MTKAKFETGYAKALAEVAKEKKRAEGAAQYYPGEVQFHLPRRADDGRVRIFSGPTKTPTAILIDDQGTDKETERVACVVADTLTAGELVPELRTAMVKAEAFLRALCVAGGQPVMGVSPHALADSLRDLVAKTEGR